MAGEQVAGPVGAGVGAAAQGERGAGRECVGRQPQK